MKNFLSKLWNGILEIIRSIYSTFALFKLRKMHFLIALFVFFITVALSSLPSYINYTKRSGSEIMNNSVGIEQALSKIFLDEDYKINCKIKDNLLVCEENFELEKIISVPVITKNIITGTEIINNLDYRLVVNTDFVDTPPAYEPASENDNYILIGKSYFSSRYVWRDHTKEKVYSTSIFGNYSLLNGFDFEESFNKIYNGEENLLKESAASIEVQNFIANINKSHNQGQLFTNLIIASISTLFFVLISGFLLRGTNLFTKGKGLKYKETLKIASFATLQPLVIGLAMNKIIDFTLVFSFAYLIRIVFIVQKYINSRKFNFNEKLVAGEI